MQISEFIKEGKFSLINNLTLNFEPIENNFYSYIENSEKKHRSQRDLERQINHGDLKNRDSRPWYFNTRKYPKWAIKPGTVVYAREHVKMLGNSSITNWEQAEWFKDIIQKTPTLEKWNIYANNTYYRFLKAKVLKHEWLGKLSVENIECTPRIVLKTV